MHNSNNAAFCCAFTQGVLLRCLNCRLFLLSHALLISLRLCAVVDSIPASNSKFQLLLLCGSNQLACPGLGSSVRDV